MQTSGISVFQHGQMVYERYETLADALDEIVYEGKQDALTQLDPTAWRIPAWLHEHAKAVRDLIDNIGSTIPHYYMLYHDCGKPYCRTVDSEGRQHFKGHAAVSECVMRRVAETHDFGGRMSRDYFDHCDMLEVAALIGQDMDAHLLKQDGVAEFASRYYAPLLLLVALSEIHANAGMFGPEGLNSVSFKIKFKQLDKMGKRVLDAIKAAHESRISATS